MRRLNLTTHSGLTSISINGAGGDSSGGSGATASMQMYSMSVDNNANLARPGAAL